MIANTATAPAAVQIQWEGGHSAPGATPILGVTVLLRGPRTRSNVHFKNQLVQALRRKGSAPTRWASTRRNSSRKRVDLNETTRLHATLDCRRLCRAEATPRHTTLDKEVRRRLCVDGVARRHATSDMEGHRNEEEDAVDRHHHHTAAGRRLEEVLDHTCVTSPATLDPRQGSSSSAATDHRRRNATMVCHLDVDPRHAVMITVGGACRRVDVSNRHTALTIAGHVKSMQ
ncbi:hypothetical protein PF010_g5893 [Phytophthora fragariae]|uniref:Uncharacterized protein n=2 Tax=Phytophthora fragariae TaxID=53985 RepID=A0A6G0LMK2_9STRA|nr:hypothetical protein PF010_g5893 [Phytophthora fragariae]